MADSVLSDLFDRWEQVWHEGRYDLIAACVAPVYVRHDDLGSREVTPAEYQIEIDAFRQEHPNTRFIVYEYATAGDRVWFRFTLKWDDAATGERCQRGGLQLFRIEGGRLAENWLTMLKLGTAWPDATGQDRWVVER